MYIDFLEQSFNSEKTNMLLSCIQEDVSKQIYLYVSNKCNLSCHHCYLEKNIETENWDVPTIRNYISQLVDEGYNRIKITGGEPFLYAELRDLLGCIFEYPFEEIQIETNGTILNEEIINTYLTHPNVRLSISLDHYIPEVHNQFRHGTRAFEKSVRFIEYVLQRGIKTRVTTVLYRGNYKVINQIITHIYNMGADEHRIIFNIHPSGNAEIHKGIELSLEECMETLDLVTQSPFFYSDHLILSLPPAFLPYEKMLNFKACGWGRNVLGILPNGDLTMCYGKYTKDIPAGGNIRDVTANEIKHQPYFKHLNVIRDQPQGICGNCIFYSLCQGMCKLSSYTHYKAFNAPYPFCQRAYDSGIFPLYAIKNPHTKVEYKSSGNVNRLIHDSDSD